mmetsp:Transcript_130532/g.418533  ORF Transcript_130532/g.418533 Transcript_130532/m.418533 type:complete len:213 (+) Transcript_130532:128-766(+)
MPVPQAIAGTCLSPHSRVHHAQAMAHGHPGAHRSRAPGSCRRFQGQIRDALHGLVHEVVHTTRILRGRAEAAVAATTSTAATSAVAATAAATAAATPAAAATAAAAVAAGRGDYAATGRAATKGAPIVRRRTRGRRPAHLLWEAAHALGHHGVGGHRVLCSLSPAHRLHARRLPRLLRLPVGAESGVETLCLLCTAHGATKVAGRRPSAHAR